MPINSHLRAVFTVHAYSILVLDLRYFAYFSSGNSFGGSWRK